MTTERQFAETLAGWLAEGPRKAPDRPLQLALDHARRHPRRPDPMTPFRRDPMPARARGGQIRPVSLALAALGLLLVALAGAAIVGSLRVDGPVPVPTATPSPTASASPAEPSPTTRPTPAQILVPIETGTAARITVLVTDQSGRLSDAVSGPSSMEGGTVPSGQIQVSREADDTLRLTWTDAACSIDYRLTIEADARSIVLEAPPCEGDTIALDRVLLLVFDGPIDPGSVTATVRPVD